MRSLVRTGPRESLVVTPLIYAIISCTDQNSGTLETVRLLLDAGAAVNARDGKGRTALRWAELRDQAAIANILRTCGQADLKHS